MRWTKIFLPTVREDPQEAEAVSHKLMVRAGLIRRLAAGAYMYLPLGYKILKKVERIISEEMDASGAMQLLMPALQPVDLWKKTGRYDVIGDVMIKFNDRHGREVALGPTHEEIVTYLAANDVRSYKELPITLYQIQTKFRDEVRPRFGIVRSCEFIMKDAYSFDINADAMTESYKIMYDAYCRIFERCGVPYVPVEADSGMMGGAGSHEFMIPAEIGEDNIIICDKCGYAASAEVAEIKPDAADNAPSKTDNMKPVSTPGKSSVNDVSLFLDVAKEKIIKTLIYATENGPVAVLLRGDHEANEPKIKKALNVVTLALADNDTVKETTGCETGFAGPVGLEIPVYADHSIVNMQKAVTGANKKDTHFMNVTPGFDFTITGNIDARDITSEDGCPKCGGRIIIKNAIEIGHTFKLGTKYSEPLGAKYLDANGKEQFMVMGCYGIGVNRILAASIEASHDDKGIIWPVSIAPFEVAIIPITKSRDNVFETADAVYEDLLKAGIDVILDDRLDKSPGIKFNDADLIGFPVQIIIGKKNIVNGKVEVKLRKTGEVVLIDIKNIKNTIKTLIKDN